VAAYALAGRAGKVLVLEHTYRKLIKVAETTNLEAEFCGA
jgi:hypothetical protein